MRIHLSQALQQASRDDHAPEPVTADEVMALAREHQAPRRRHTWWIAGGCCAVLLALVGFLASRPQPLNPPTPSPTATPAFVWTGTDPTEVEFSDAEVARRCPLAHGQHYSTFTSSRTAGGYVTILDAGVKDSQDAVGTTCLLGYQRAPSRERVTRDEARTLDSVVTSSCSGAAGLDLDEASGWRLVVESSTTMAATGRAMNQVAYLWRDTWLATCLLPEGENGLVELTNLAVQHSPDNCPAPAGAGTYVADSKPTRISSVEFDGMTPVLTPQGKLDTRVGYLEVSAAGAANTVRIDVQHGIAMSQNRRLGFRPPVVEPQNQAYPDLHVALLDGQNKVLRRCTSR